MDRSMKVLVADDQPDVLEALRLLLKREGMEMAKASSPAGVLSALQAEDFDAALIGKSLLAGYTKLGGARAFGAALTQAEVDTLAGAYSPATERLHPHPGVKLGS